jgi:hypothetical protein
MTAPFVNRYSSQDQFLIKVSSLAGYWDTCSGGEPSSPTTKKFIGGQLRSVILTGRPVTSDLEITKIFDPVVDPSRIKSLLQVVGSFIATVSVTPTDDSLRPNGAPRLYIGAVLVGVTMPEVDANSDGEAAMWGLTFAVPGVG